MLIKSKRAAGMSLLATLLLLGCSTSQTTETGNDTNHTSEEESRIQAYLEQETNKTDVEKIEEFRGQLEGLSKFYQGGFNYQFYMKAHKDTVTEPALQLMYETYGSIEGDYYTIPVKEYNIGFDGTYLQVQDRSLPQGNVYVQSNVIYDGTYIYEDVDRLLVFANSMVEDNPLVNNIRTLLFEDGLEGRLSKFEGNYKGYWLRSETDQYTQPVDAIQSYFSGLHGFSTDKNTVIDQETNTVVMTLTLEEVQELNNGQQDTFPLFYETYNQEGEDGYTYELHYNLEQKTFSAHLIAPEGSGLNSYYSTMAPYGDLEEIVLPDEQHTLIETDKFYDDYTTMLGIKQDYLEAEVSELEGE